MGVNEELANKYQKNLDNRSLIGILLVAAGGVFVGNAYSLSPSILFIAYLLSGFVCAFVGISLLNGMRVLAKAFVRAFYKKEASQ